MSKSAMRRLGWRPVSRLAIGLLAAFSASSAALTAWAGVETGAVQFQPAADEGRIDAIFRLEPHRFTYRREPIETSAADVEISHVMFPSPVVTPEENNNTVHCEYFRPLAPGERPAVIVLHILGGDFDLARLFSRYLAHQGVAALFLKMPYYGPRRQPESAARMISDDPQATVAGMRQAVLDIRRAAAWLATRPEVDANQLGVFGISLGGITAGLAASAEPRLSNVCLMLAGGDIARVTWSNPEMAKIRRRWEEQGGTLESFTKVLRPVDPLTHAEHLRDRRVLMINASRDEVVPRRCTESLWRAAGGPPIIWFDAGHYSSARFLLEGMGHVACFFAQPSLAVDSPTGR